MKLKENQNLEQRKPSVTQKAKMYGVHNSSE